MQATRSNNPTHVFSLKYMLRKTIKSRQRLDVGTLHFDFPAKKSPPASAALAGAARQPTSPLASRGLAGRPGERRAQGHQIRCPANSREETEDLK